MKMARGDKRLFRMVLRLEILLNRYTSSWDESGEICTNDGQGGF